MPRDPFDDLEPDAPEPTARPMGDDLRHRADADDEKIVPLSNVGGAAPTSLGLDSGGNLPGSEDDLANLSEPEPPEPPEVGAVHVRDDAQGGAPRRDEGDEGSPAKPRE